MVKQVSSIKGTVKVKWKGVRLVLRHFRFDWYKTVSKLSKNANERKHENYDNPCLKNAPFSTPPTWLNNWTIPLDAD